MKKPLGTPTPIVEGSQATFLFRGKKAPRLIGDLNDWNEEKALPFKPAGRGAWSLTVELPADAYMEYGLLLDGERIVDPANPQRVANGYEVENNYFYMPEGGPTPLAERRRGVPRGKVTSHSLLARYYVEDEHAIDLFKRRVHLYRPPVSEPCPLLVVFDGKEYLRRANLPALLDNLIHEQRIRPVAAAFVANGGTHRFVEYACNDATLGFLLYNVIPLAQEHLNLIDLQEEPGAYGVLGASMGGLISLYSAVRFPHVFGHALSQSGAFEPGFVINDLVRLREPSALKIWMDVGTFDFLYNDNRQMAGLLSERGYDVTYAEYSGGHNYTAWRNDLVRGLETVFGDPGRAAPAL